MRRHREGRVVLVPTMGALHAGHLSLVEMARHHGDQVVVSIFVNPLQFDRETDLAAYPRDLEGDSVLCRAAGVDVLFAPGLEEMYPRPPDTRVGVGAVAEHMEGRFRPGHFDGVGTVVIKLLSGVQPDIAIFGRKDAQQLAVIRTAVSDLSLPVEILCAPTVREADGLALSSRNRLLDAEGRRQALRISAGLSAAADLVEDGVVDRGRLVDAVRSHLGDLRTDYVELADQDRAQPMAELDRPAFLAVAAWVGEIRLIDNLWLPGPGRVERGVVWESGR